MNDSVHIQRPTFEQTYKTLTNQLRYFATRRGVPAQDCDDLMHEAYAKVLGRIEEIEIRSLEAYLRTTFARCVVDFHRDKRPELTGWGDKTRESLPDLEQLADRHNYVVDNSAIVEDRVRCVQKVLEEIEQRNPLAGVALELAFHGVSGRDMSDALNKSESAANQFLSQTRKLFESLLKERCDEHLERRGASRRRQQND